MPEIMVRFDDLRRYCEKRHCGSVPIEYIKQMPTIEVEPVRKPEMSEADRCPNRLKTRRIAMNKNYFDESDNLVNVENKSLAEIYMDGAKQNRWISVEDALPDAYIYVICTGKDGMAILRYNGEVWVDDTGCIYPMSAITHWMPLPEPPKE